MSIEVLISIIGWVGTFLIVLAYFLVSYKKVGSDAVSYQLMNLFGAMGVGVNVFYNHAWPAVALQVVWGIIAILSLLKNNKTNQTSIDNN